MTEVDTRTLPRYRGPEGAVSSGGTTIAGMIAIMTVTGRDHTGIIAAVATACADLGINILNVSQTIMDEWFTMILHVELPEELDVTSLDGRMAEVENDQKLVITVQSQAIFDAMHHI